MRLAAAVLFTLLPQFAQEPGRVYVFAPSHSEASAWIAVSCDGVQVAELKRGRFFAMSIPPGRHTFMANESVPVAIQAVAGQDVFLRLNWHHTLGLPPIPMLGAIPAEKAKREMRFLNYIDAKKIHSPLVEKKAPRPEVPMELRRRETP